MSLGQSGFRMLLGKALLPREFFAALPESDAPRGTLRKVLTGNAWHMIESREESGDLVEFAWPIEIGTFVWED